MSRGDHTPVAEASQHLERARKKERGDSMTTKRLSLYCRMERLIIGLAMSAAAWVVERGIRHSTRRPKGA